MHILSRRMVSPLLVNIKTLKVRLIAHKCNTGWWVGVVKSTEQKKSFGLYMSDRTHITVHVRYNLLYMSDMSD